MHTSFNSLGLCTLERSEIALVSWLRKSALGWIGFRLYLSRPSPKLFPSTILQQLGFRTSSATCTLIFYIGYTVCRIWSKCTANFPSMSNTENTRNVGPITGWSIYTVIKDISVNVMQKILQAIGLTVCNWPGKRTNSGALQFTGQSDIQDSNNSFQFQVWPSHH